LGEAPSAAPPCDRGQREPGERLCVEALLVDDARRRRAQSQRAVPEHLFEMCLMAVLVALRAHLRVGLERDRAERRARAHLLRDRRAERREVEQHLVCSAFVAEPRRVRRIDEVAVEDRRGVEDHRVALGEPRLRRPEVPLRQRPAAPCARRTAPRQVEEALARRARRTRASCAWSSRAR
jgi:hypothetical protein